MQTGDRLGHYSLLHPLGKGGMGEVWKARDESLGRDVALKFLSQHSPEDLARFQREAQLAAKLSHPNIAAVYEATDDYIAMQFIDGAPLDRVRLSSRDAAAALRDAARAVDVAHRQGILHRDLKPSNIMIENPLPRLPSEAALPDPAHEGRRRRVYVMDFGLARPLKADSSLTVSGVIMGTPAFMSPEQARGDKVHVRSDVYSLGATLYELLAGRAPFAGDDPLAVMGDVANADPLPPRRLARSLDRDLETIVLKAMEKDPSRRYASAAGLADDLDRFLRGDPVTARRASVAYRLRKRIRKQPVAFGLGAALAASLITVPILLLAQRSATARDHAAKAHSILASLPVERRARIDALVSADAHARFADRPDLRDRVNRQLGDLALEGGDFALARLAYSACSDAARRIQEVDDRQSAVLRQRADRIKQVLDDVSRGLGRDGRDPSGPLLDDCVMEIGSYRDEQTVALLRDALRPHVGRARDRGSEARWTAEDRDVVKFIVRALVALDVDAGVPVLAEFMEVLWDDDLAVECGLALCNTRRAAAHAPLLAARDRFGINSNVWRQISSRFGRVPDPAGTGPPRTAEEFQARGLARYGKRDLDGAIADYTRATELDATHAPAFTNRGKARQEKGDLDGAIADYTRAAELDPRDAIAFNNRGLARRKKRDLDGAIADCTRAIEIQPGYALAYGNRGSARRDRARLLAGSGRGDDAAVELDGAIADYTRAIELDPTFALAYSMRGLLRNDKRDIEGALADCTRAIELDPRDTDAFVNRGNVRYASQDLDRAIADYTRAIELHPRCAPAFINRGFCSYYKRAFDRAIDDWQRFLQLAPGDPQVPAVREFLARARAELEKKP